MNKEVELITYHQAHDKDTALIISAVGEGPHQNRYVVTSGADENFRIEVNFQDGPVKDGVPNGLSLEALLAICKHRLESFQAGQFPSTYNDRAIIYIEQALASLHQRTNLRVKHGVEGTMTGDPEHTAETLLAQALEMAAPSVLFPLDVFDVSIVEGAIEQVFELQLPDDLLDEFGNATFNSMQEVQDFWLPKLEALGWK